MAAIDDLTDLVANLPNASLITPAMKQSALDGSRVPDAAGVWPGQDGYTATYDVYWAAISLVGFLQAQPVVRQSSSEGTSVAVDAPNWSGLLAYYRGQSAIAQATSSSPILTRVTIPDVPHVYHKDMREGWNGYDDVDTDVS
jgi:hypothetical protein